MDRPEVSDKGATRLRAGLRRHGLVPRPEPVLHVVQEAGLRFTHGNRLELFRAGREGLAAMLEAIRGARSWIHLETYILRDDATGRRFLEALAERARAGVAVRLLYDAFGSLGLSEAGLEPLRRASGEVLGFNPLRRFYPRWAPRRRDHRKVLVVDGEVAFTGGLNIGDEYHARAVAREAGEQGWRDTHARVKGPAVRELSAVFLESWFRASGSDLPWIEILDIVPEATGTVSCAVLPDGPVYRRRRMRELLIAQIEGAQRSIQLTTAYFAPGRRVVEALGRAAARGVTVELVLAGRTDHPVLRRAARSIVGRLLDQGVVVHEYQGAILHAKSAVFDGQVSIIGTSNLDRQSLEHSYEVNVIALGEEPAQRLVAFFEQDRVLSKRLDPAFLARRNWLERLLDRAAAWLLIWI